MLATIKLFTTRCFEAVSSLVASVIWIVAKLLGFAFATGLAFGAICAFIACGVLWYFLSSSSIDDKTVYRHLVPHSHAKDKGNKGCGAPGDAVPTLANPNGSINADGTFSENLSTDTANFYNCSIQSHVNQSVTYSMAFLEFNDQGQLREPLQWEALKHELTAPTNQSLTVLVYVHGWRHDAHVGDSDVRRFHTLTSLTANYANQDGRKPSKTIGIYIGWRGRVIDEHADHEKTSPLRDGMAIPTILSRKPASDSIAKPIGQQILDIEKLVKGAKLDASHRKLIVYGHSLGGNIVIQGLSETIAKRISEPEPGQPIGGVGDLVVLLNPASQARHFFTVQQSAFSTKLPEYSSPYVVSLTAAKYYDRLTKERADWDTAVGKYLPIAHTVLSLNTGQLQDIQSIGNYLPYQVLAGSPTQTISSSVYGVSHEIEFDNSANSKTSYSLAGKNLGGVTPHCPRDTNFMRWTKSSKQSESSPLSKGWNAHLLLDKPDKNGKIQVNIRQGAARHRCRGNPIDEEQTKQCRTIATDSGIDIEPEQRVQIPHIGPAWSPVWNAAVHSNVIEEHGGYLSHTLWCVLNRFALDRTEAK
jgi:hypothetical protein